MKLRVIAVLAVAVLVHGLVYASGADLVRKAYSTERNAVLTGVLTSSVYISGQRQQSNVKVYRLGQKTRMEYLSGPMEGTVVIDDGKAIYRLDRSSQTVYIALQPPAPDNVNMLLKNYKAVPAGTGTVAGRKAQIIRLEPRTAGNPKAKLWIDTGTGVVLRNERYLYNGKLATSSVYTSINYRSKPGSSLFVPPKQWKQVKLNADNQPLSAAELRDQVGFTPLKPSYMPKGYSFDGYHKRFSGRGRPVAVLKYTDGFNSLTIFERECGGGQMGRGRGRGWGRRWQGGGQPGTGECLMRSDPNAQVAQTRVNDLMITITADMDPKQLQKIAGSF